VDWKIAELPKDKPEVSPAFLCILSLEYLSKGERPGKEVGKNVATFSRSQMVIHRWCRVARPRKEVCKMNTFNNHGLSSPALT
jgi:hypothetical protein